MGDHFDKGTNKVRNRTQKRGLLPTRTHLKVDGITIPRPYVARVTEAIDKSPTGKLPAHDGGNRGNYFVEINIDGERLQFPAEYVIIDRRLEEFSKQEHSAYVQRLLCQAGIAGSSVQ